MTLYESFIPPVSKSLAAMSGIMEKAEAFCAEKEIEPSALLDARLAPDMWPLLKQVQNACDLTRRGAMRLAGTPPESVPDTETSFAELRARIAATIAFLEAQDRDAYAGAETLPITLKTSAGEMQFTGATYLGDFLIPNIYFHLAMVYGILRHNGLELNKRDFLAS